jgi:death-on-curing protein
MTKEKKPSAVKYLSFEDVRDMYLVLFERFKEIDEPIPPWDLVNKKNVEHLVELPRNSFFGNEQYPTLESKAAIMLYKINKGHIFPNGNKRMSISCLLLFLDLNGKTLDISSDEATLKALELANSDAKDFDSVKAGLERWISEHMVEGS